MDIPEKTDATSSLLRFELSIPAPGEEVYCHWFLSALHRGRSGYRQSAIITVRAVSRQAGRMGAERRTGGRPFHPVDSNDRDRDRSPANHVWLGWNEYHIHTSERASERLTAAEIPIAIVQGRRIVFSPGCERDRSRSFNLRKWIPL